MIQHWPPSGAPGVMKVKLYLSSSVNTYALEGCTQTTPPTCSLCNTPQCNLPQLPLSKVLMNPHKLGTTEAEIPPKTLHPKRGLGVKCKTVKTGQPSVGTRKTVGLTKTAQPSTAGEKRNLWDQSTPCPGCPPTPHEKVSASSSQSTLRRVPRTKPLVHR